MHHEALTAQQRIELLSHFARIVAIPSLDRLLDIVIQDTPHLVNGAGCSVYLRPEYVPQFDGTLIDEKGQSVRADQIRQDFVVLAATSRPRVKTEGLIGKGFYTSGSGLTGWVFKYSRPLRLNDCSDRKELQSYAPDLHWSDKYKGNNDFYDPTDRKPILIVPLLGPTRTIGVLKVPATVDKQPFTEVSEAIVVLIAQIVASAIHTSWLIQEQSRNIYHLVEIGAKAKPEDVFEAVTYRLGRMLDRPHCQLYLLDGGGSVVKLTFADGKRIARDSATAYKRGQDLIGWVFKTGKPLLISDVRKYADAQYLDDVRLETISDGARIDEEDRYLKCEQASSIEGIDSPVSFLAVPVRANDGSVQGVLCVNNLDDLNYGYATQFSDSDRQLAQSFASNVSLAIANEHQRILGNLLTVLGHSWEPNRLFDVVVQDVPKLVFGTGCSIYILEKGEAGSQLRLVSSSWEGISIGGTLAEIVYAVNEGKTGFCASTRATLIVNHYGPTITARRAMNAEMQRVIYGHPNDLIAEIRDDRGKPVGIIQLRRGLNTSRQFQLEFRRLAKVLVVHQYGLPSPKASLYSTLNLAPSWSFLAAPIKSESDDLYGVITVGRAVQQSPFSPEDATLLETIASRLAAILLNLNLQKQREQLLMTVAHEINTPLQGIIADAENILYELPDGSELNRLAKHNLDQVLQLHLMTETIMGALSGQISAREYSICNIWRPIKDACEAFASEATAKGCDILEPQPTGGSRFPDIEMSLFDLTIAFKNLIHNAVKYSFGPPSGQDQRRYILITGQWADTEHLRYSISVQNYGVGITEEEIKGRLIFDPYYRGAKATDRRRTGAGLGLAYVRQIVEDLHHGTIEVTSKNLSGNAYLTTFTVTLPVRQPRSESGYSKEWTQ